MAGYNGLQILRANSSTVQTMAANQKKLLDGQPLYIKDKNYLVIGEDTKGTGGTATQSSIDKLPITVRSLEGWFADEQSITGLSEEAQQPQYSITGQSASSSLNIYSSSNVVINGATTVKINTPDTQVTGTNLNIDVSSVDINKNINITSEDMSLGSKNLDLNTGEIDVDATKVSLNGTTIGIGGSSYVDISGNTSSPISTNIAHVTVHNNCAINIATNNVKLKFSKSNFELNLNANAGSNLGCIRINSPYINFYATDTGVGFNAKESPIQFNSQGAFFDINGPLWLNSASGVALNTNKLYFSSPNDGTGLPGSFIDLPNVAYNTYVYVHSITMWINDSRGAGATWEDMSVNGTDPQGVLTFNLINHQPNPYTSASNLFSAMTANSRAAGSWCTASGTLSISGNYWGQVAAIAKNSYFTDSAWSVRLVRWRTQDDYATSPEFRANTATHMIPVHVSAVTRITDYAYRLLPYATT